MKPTFLRAVLVSLLLTVQLATVVIVVLGMRQQASEQFEQTAQTTLEQLAATIADKTLSVLEPAQNSISLTRQLLADGVLDARSNTVIGNYFRAQLRADESIAGMYLARDSGEFVYVRRDGDGLRTKIIQFDGLRRRVDISQHGPEQLIRRWQDGKDQYDPRDRQWYKTARSRLGTDWSGAYVFQSPDSAGVSAARALHYSDGSDAGVLGIDLHVNSLSDFLADALGIEQASAAILDSRSSVVAYSQATSLQPYLENGILPRVDALSDAPLLTLLQQQGIQPGKETGLDPLLARYGLSQFSIAGRSHHGVSRVVDSLSGLTGWTVVVQAPEASFAGRLDTLYERKMRTLIAVVVIPAVIALLAIFGLAEPGLTAAKESGTDALTGSLTRDEFRRRLSSMLNGRRGHEDQGQLVVVAFDIDDFARVEERLGHESSNALLKQMAYRLRTRIRQHDLLGRVGSNKFVLALRLDEHIDVLPTVNRIRRSAIAKLFSTPAGRCPLGLTAGIASVANNESMESVLARADQALFTGKARHRNRSYLASEPTMDWSQSILHGNGMAGDRHRSEPPVQAPTLET